MSIRMWGAYARIDNVVVEHENEIIGTHLFEIHFGYMNDNEFEIDGSYLIQSFNANDAYNCAIELHEKSSFPDAILSKNVRVAMW